MKQCHDSRTPRALGGDIRASAMVAALVCCLSIWSALAAPLSAQGTDAAATRARPLGSGIDAAVPLVVAPSQGDVLLLEMQQVVEMGGQRLATYSLPRSGSQVEPGRTVRPSPRTGPRKSAMPQRVTVMGFYAQSTVETNDSRGTVVSTMMDSLLVRESDMGKPPRTQRMAMPAGSKPTRIRVRQNGSMTMLDVPGSAAAVGATLSAMPAFLPDRDVKVGDTWERDVEIPPLPVPGYRADGVLRAVFKLDSITRGGRNAWVSLTGTLRRSGAARDLPPGSRVVTDGTMSGTLMLDRVRGWITEADTVIDVSSEVTAPSDGGTPVELAIRITQRLRVK